MEIREYNDVENVDDYCTRENINSEQLYRILNSLKEEEFDYNRYIPPDNTPYTFINEIFHDNCISYEDVKKFMGKFGLRYIRSRTFRKITDGCVFLFVKKNYEYVFENIKILDEKLDILFPESEILKYSVRMYPLISNEFFEKIG